MGFLSGLLGGVGTIAGGLIGGPFGAQIGGFIGGAIDSSSATKDSIRAAEDAAEAQSQSAEAAILAQQQALEQLRSDLEPYRNFGQNLIPQANNLYGADAGQNLLNDPLLQSLQNDAQQRIIAQQASVGRAGAGETPGLLQDAFMRQGLGYLSQQRSDYLNALGLGQNSAAQSGFAGVNTGQNIGSTLLQQGNVRAAGIVGAQNAQNAGLQNLANIGGGLLSYFNQPKQDQFGFTANEDPFNTSLYRS